MKEKKFVVCTIKALESMMINGVTKKDAGSRTRFELMGIVWTEPRVTMTSKYAKFVIGSWDLKKRFIWRFPSKERCGKTVNEICGGLESMGPKFFG